MFNFFETRLDPLGRKVGAATLHHDANLNQFLRGHFAKLWKYILLVAVLAGGLAACEVYLFSLLGGLVDILTIDTHKDQFFIMNRWVIAKACFILFVCLPLTVAVHALVTNQTLHGNIQVSSISRTNELLIMQNLDYFAGLPTGKIAATIAQLSFSTRYVILKTIDIFIYMLVFFISTLFLITKAHWILFVPICIWGIVYLYAIVTFVPELKKRAEMQADKRADVNASLVDVFSNIITVKLFKGEDHEIEYSKKYLDYHLRAINFSMRTISKIIITNWALNIAMISTTAGLCLHYWSISAITVGVVSSVIALVLRLYTMSSWVIWEVSGLSEQLGAIQNSLSSLKGAKPVRALATSQVSNVESDFSISFRAVCFGFEPSILVLDEFNLHIHHAEKFGIVGASGSGKSTLVKLLTKLYPVASGEIVIGSSTLQTLSANNVSAYISVVTQDVELFNRSIYDNITYGQKGVPPAKVIEVSKLVCAHEFIELLKDESGNTGYNYVVGERGGRLSGGQKQRIALARALLKDSPILILDEATSALDPITEATVVNNLMQFSENKTLIFITHRISNVRMMDRIAVVESGRAVEIGHHNSLMKQKSLYYALWNAQMRNASNVESEDMRTYSQGN